MCAKTELACALPRLLFCERHFDDFEIACRFQPRALPHVQARIFQMHDLDSLKEQDLSIARNNGEPSHGHERSSTGGIFGPEFRTFNHAPGWEVAGSEAMKADIGGSFALQPCHYIRLRKRPFDGQKDCSAG